MGQATTCGCVTGALMALGMAHGCAGLLGLGYHQFRGLYRKYAGALDAAPKAP